MHHFRRWDYSVSNRRAAPVSLERLALPGLANVSHFSYARYSMSSVGELKEQYRKLEEKLASLRKSLDFTEKMIHDLYSTYGSHNKSEFFFEQLTSLHQKINHTVEEMSRIECLLRNSSSGTSKGIFDW